MRQFRWLSYILLMLALSVGSHSLSARPVLLLDVSGAIGPASADYIVRGVEEATRINAQLIVLRIDTPGGLDKSMRTIIKHILSAQVPVASFVAPSGARAASAGTFILYASHIAAMAPATNLGAATPVNLAPSTPTPVGQQPEQNTPETDKPKGAVERKVVNDAAAYIESLAKLRNRNSEWAVKAVRQGASLPALQALEENVIDFIASDVDELLRRVDGRSVELDQGTLTLDTREARVALYEPDWRSRFLSVITDPNIAYVLMLVGIYGLIFEFSNPGMVGPGIIGAICLLLALYAFQVLPVSYAGAGLILLGIALIVAEALVPSFGVFGAGGIAAFIIGSIILIDTELPAYQIALPLILSVAAASTACLLIVLRLLLRSRKKAVVTGPSSFIGQQAIVEEVSDPNSWVRFSGERWQAYCTESLQIGDRVEIQSIDGLQLVVKKIGG